MAFKHKLMTIVSVMVVLMGGGLTSVVNTTTSAQAATSLPKMTVDAKAGIAIDAASGKILFDQNGSEVLPIASMTKMMTIYLVRAALKSGKLTWDQEISVPDNIYRLSQETELSNVPLRKDKTYTVRELYEASLIYSANAAAMLLGQTVAGGDQDKFIDMMRAQAKKWNLTDAHIVNATGLNNSFLEGNTYPGTDKNDENKMSAQDVATIAQHLLNEFPDVLDTTKIPEKTFQKGTSDAIVMQNWDWMLPGDLYQDKSLPVDGLKTGTTDLAGACFTGTAEIDGRRVITVVMNASNQDQDKGARFVETKKIMHYAFDNWQKVTFFKKGTTATTKKSVTVKDGAEDKADLIYGKAVTLLVPTGTQASELKATYHGKDTVTAPTKANQKVGTITFSATSDDLGSLPGSKGNSTTVVTKSAVAKPGFFGGIVKGISNFFGNLF